MRKLSSLFFFFYVLLTFTNEIKKGKKIFLILLWNQTKRKKKKYGKRENAVPKCLISDGLFVSISASNPIYHFLRIQ